MNFWEELKVESVEFYKNEIPRIREQGLMLKEICNSIMIDERYSVEARQAAFNCYNTTIKEIRNLLSNYGRALQHLSDKDYVEVFTGTDRSHYESRT